MKKFLFAISGLLILIYFGLNSCRPQLHTSDTNQTFQFLIFSDLHIQDLQHPDSPVYQMFQEAQQLISTRQEMFTSSDSLPQVWVFNGDLTDSGKEEQWNAYTELVDSFTNLTNLIVMENFGNHDGGPNDAVRQGIAKRNLRQPQAFVSDNGLFRAENFGPFRLVTLGAYPGNVWNEDCEWCHYFKDDFKHPEYSLDFLIEDLQNPENEQQQYVLFFHYGWDEFSLLWWTKKEQNAFYKAIKNHRIKAIFTGHNHHEGHRKWKGIDVFSCGSPQKNGETGNFLWVTLQESGIRVQSLEKGKKGTFSFSKNTSFQSTF
jgi:predicted phosphodiesterase